ncbi:MAG: glycosyltransferase family 39 protein [bacterium]|nr:glycosyltransferase family 39 protein [bacterium]
MNKERLLHTSFVVLILASCTVSLLTLYSQSIRLDESQSIWASTRSIPGLLAYIAQDVHVPLYALILHIWMQIFGTDIMVVRSLSFVFFVLTLPFMYWFAKESSSKRAAYLTVALFSLSPFVMWYSNEARMYTLFTLVTSVNHLYFLRMVRSEGKTSKFGYLVSAIAGLYTHYFFFFLLITQGIFILGRMISFIYTDQEFGSKSLWELIKKYLAFPLKWLGIATEAFLFLLPWITYVYSLGTANNASPMIPRPTSFNLFQTIVQFLFGFQTQAVQAFIIALWPLTLIMLFMLFTKRKRLPVEGIGYFGFVTVLPIILVFFVSFIRPIFLTRYLILVTPSLFFILAWSMLSYSKKVSTYLVTTFMLVLLGLSGYQNISSATPVKEDYAGVDTYLSMNTTAKDIIAVSAPFTIYPIEYGYDGQAKIDTIPLWNRYDETGGAIPPYSDEKLKAQIEAYKKQYKRVFIVLSYDQGYEEKIRKYMDENYEIYKTQRFSSGLEMRSYILRYDVQ